MTSNFLVNKNFSFMWAGKAVSQIGDKFYAIALAWWILQRSGSTAIMGLFMAASVLPGLLIGPFVGALIDRHNKKPILIASDLFRGVVVLCVSILSATGSLALWHIFAGAVIISATSAFFDPSALAVIPQIVDKKQLQKANALNQMLGAFTMVLGPALGAVCVGWFGFTLVFFINAASYFASALFEGFMELGKAVKLSAESHSLLEETKEGFHYLFARKKLLLVISIIGIAHFFVGALMVALPFLAKQLTGNSLQHLGNLEMLLGLGMLLGSAYLHINSGSITKAKYLFLCLLLMGICYIGIGASSMLAVRVSQPYLFIMLIVGIVIANASIFWQSLLQMITPEHLRGRVFSISTMVGNTSLPLSYSIFGILLVRIPLSVLMLASGACLTLIMLMLLLTYPRDNSVETSNTD